MVYIAILCPTRIVLNITKIPISMSSIEGALNSALQLHCVVFPPFHCGLTKLTPGEARLQF